MATTCWQAWGNVSAANCDDNELDGVDEHPVGAFLGRFGRVHSTVERTRNHLGPACRSGRFSARGGYAVGLMLLPSGFLVLSRYGAGLQGT